MHLKNDCREYASEDVVRQVINKYSNFVNSPIKLNGSEINTIQVLVIFFYFYSFYLRKMYVENNIAFVVTRSQINYSRTT